MPYHLRVCPHRPFSALFSLLFWPTDEAMERAMLWLARCLDWICNAFAAGAQDSMRINQLICPIATRLSRGRDQEPS